MAVISMKALLESGVHFGHRTNKWDPRMKPFIFTERNGIHIIDLQQTSKLLSTAYNVVRAIVFNGNRFVRGYQLQLSTRSLNKQLAVEPSHLADGWHAHQRSPMQLVSNSNAS